MGPITKIVGGAIGLAKEYNASRREQRSRSTSPLPPTINTPDSEHHEDHKIVEDLSDYDEDPLTDHDEQQWELDEAQHEIASSPPATDALSGDAGRDVEDILAAYFAKHPQPPAYSKIRGLSAPVILPQRRPQMNTRGFIRAYAPVLQDVDISQDAWMDFLNGFHKAIKMSPYFHATNLAFGITAITVQAIAGPNIMLQAGAFAIHLSVEASRRGYTRYQTNKYLDTMNEQLFKPRGLYALIMTYKPSSASADTVVDLNTSIAKAVGARSTSNRSLLSKFSSSSGKTVGDIQLPVSAPLIFPALDTLDPAKKESFMQKHGGFMNDYFDRRAQARFEAENPGSRLNVARPKEFASRYSDPTHAVYSGGLISFVSGGNVQTHRSKARRGIVSSPSSSQDYHAESSPAHTYEDEKKTSANGSEVARSGGYTRPRTGLLSSVKKQLREDVLYLMVVNLPTDEEMREVGVVLDRVEREID